MDSRKPIVEPQVAQIYQSRHDEHYQILYVDEQVVLLRCDTPGRNREETHRIERRTAFNREVEAGHFEHKPESPVDMMDLNEMDWSQVSLIGDKTSKNLHDAGYKTTLDVQQSDDDDLLNIDGLGNAGLSNLREFVN